MRARNFRSVECVDCGSPVPCLTNRMRRCPDCVDKHMKEVRKRAVEENEQELTRL
jgi:hypothetical protein